MKSLFRKLKSIQPKSQTTINLQWLKDLDSEDDLTALEKTARFLLSFISDTSVPVSPSLQTLFTIDERNRQRIEKVFQQYIKFENLRPELDARISEAIYYYYRQLSLNYLKHMEALLALPDKLGLHYEGFPLVLGRAMHSTLCMIRIRYFSRQPSPDGAWAQLFQLFTIAEQEALLDVPLRLYDDMPPAKLGALFIHECMLNSINLASMSRQQIDLTRVLIKHLVPNIKITKEYNEKRHFHYVDLAVDKGVQRVRQFKLTPTCRFWNSEQLLITSDLLFNAIKSGKSLEPFALSHMASNPYLLETLTFLRSEWSPTEYCRQRRKEERKNTGRVASVSWGIESVITQIKEIANKRVYTGKSTPSFYSMGDRWIIRDESNKGFGAEVSTEHSLSLKPNKLVTIIFNAVSEGCTIGIVKNVVELPQGKRHVGIEVISKLASLVQVLRMDVSDPANTDDVTSLSESMLGVTGLYLPAEEGLSESASIIIPRVSFLENTLYQISSKDKKIAVRLGAALEIKDDWARINL